MGKKRTFKVGEDVYDIPQEKVDEFLSRKKDAIEVKSYIVDKDTFDVPLDKIEGFIGRKPQAKPLYEEEQEWEGGAGSQSSMGAVPTITLNSTRVANEPPTTVEEKGGKGPIKPGGGFTIGETPKLTKQTHDIFQKHALELPDRVKSDKRSSDVFVNTFAKKLNLNPRELRQVYNDTVKNETALKQLKEVYDQNPDDTDVLYRLADLHNALGQYDLAYEAYAALEGKLRKKAEGELSAQGVTARPPGGEQYGLNVSDIGNKRPDYVQQRMLPAIAGMAYTKWQMGDEAEARRLQAIAEKYGYKGQEFSSVGSGSTFQPQSSPTRYGFAPKQGTTTDEQGNVISDTAPTPESEAMTTIANGLSDTFGAGQAMTEHGIDKTVKGVKEGNLLTTFTGAVETLMGVAGQATPAGSLFMMPLVGVQTVAPEVAEWMMPLSKGLHAYYEKKGEPIPEWAENATILSDLALLGWLTHAGSKKVGKAMASREFGKLFDELPPESVEKLAKTVEKRWEASGKDPEVYGAEMKARVEELKPQLEEIKSEVESMQVEAEPYNPPPHPESLRTVEEGSSIVMNGEEGILERGDDGTWYHTTDKKSTQIKVEDKFNPTESLKELGIEVLPEITPEQVARATADAEQVGRVTVNGKEYFVSLDRVGNENPTGDLVLEVKPDGTMINRFDSHPDTKFAKERKLKVINEFLKKNNKPPRKALTEVARAVEGSDPLPKTEVEPVVGVEDVPLQEIPADLQENGIEVVSMLEAEKLQGDGYRMFAMHEQGDVPHEIFDVGELRNYSEDQLIAYKEPSPTEIKPIQDEKINQERREERLLEEPLSMSEKPTPNEPVSSEVEVKPIRQLGTGANVYFETKKYRVNDSQKGKVLLNVGDAKGETPLANIEFNTPEEAVFVAKRLQENAPDGLVSDYHNIDKIIEGYKEEYKQSLKTDVKPEPKPLRPESPEETLVRDLQQDIKNIGYEIGHEMEMNSLSEFSPDMYAVQNMPWIKPESAAKETGGKVGSKGDINPSMVNKLKGVSAERAGEILANKASEDGLHPHLDSQDWRNIVIEILHAGSKESYIKNNTKFGKERTRILKQEMGEKKAELAEAIKDLENADWEKLGFDSKKEFKQHVRDIKKGTPKQEAEAMEMVEQMDDATVDRLIKELDENFPTTEEEINKFYEKHGIEEGSISAEASSPKTAEGSVEASKPQASGEGELVYEPPTLTSKDKALKAVDDLENFLLNLPGIKDNVGGERMGAPFSAEEAVKFFTNTLREGLEQGYKIKEAIERAIGRLGEHKTHSELLNSIDEGKLREGALKQYEGQDINRPIEAQFGASHASVAEVRKLMGIEDGIEVTERVRRDVKSVMEEGKELASKIDLDELSDQVIYDGRSLNANEQAALVFRETELYNEVRKLEEEIAKATAKGDLNVADQAQIMLSQAINKQSSIMKALDIAGSEMGLAFRMRQVMNKRDYSLISLEKRWTQASGGAQMPANVRKQFSDMVKDLEAKNKRFEELLEVKDKQLAEQALANIQESLGREKSTPPSVLKAQKLARKKELSQKFRGRFNDISNIAATLADKEFYEYSKLVLEEAVGDFKEFSKRMMAELGGKVEPYLQEIYDKANKSDYDAPYLDENGDLKLDNQMLRDVVESLEIDPKLKQKNPQEFIDKVHEIVKEEFPDIERRKVQDAISGYGKKINSSIDDLQREVNSLKRDLKLVSGLEDARAGKGVLKSGYSPPKPTDMQRENQREIHKELKKYPQDQASLDKKWATALDRTKSALKNSITDLTKRIEDIKAGTATPKTPRDRIKLDAEAEMMKEVVDDLKAQLEALEGKKTLSIEQRIDMAIEAARRTQELYERRTKEIRDTGTYTRDTPVELRSPELDLARQVRDMAKAEYDAAIQSSGIGDAAKAARDLSASEKRVAELENKIKSNQIGYAAKAQRALFKTPELEASLAKEKALKDVINKMREEQGLVEAHARDLWKARKQRQIAEIERRIREKDYAKKVKPELELDIEMERLQAEMDRKKFDLDVEIEKEKYRSKGFLGNVGEHISDVMNMPKSLMASADLSAPLRQGAILSTRHPILAARAFKEMINQFLSGKEAQKWHDDLIRTDGYIRAKKSGLFISEPMARLVAKEEAFMSNLAEKIPVYGRFVKGSNRAYSAFLNKMRMDVFNQHHKALVDAGFKGEAMKKELGAMAYLINNFTGRGGLGKAEIAAPLLNSLFFAPRFVKSRLNILADTASGFGLIQSGLSKTAVGRGMGLKGTITPRARIEAYKAMASYIGTGWIVLQLAKLAGADVEADPRSSDFGKIKIGDTRYDIWAGLQQPAVLFSRLKTQATKSTITGKITPFREGYKADNGLDVLGRFLRTKTSPQLSTFLSQQSGEFMDRKPFSWGEAAKGMVVPLVYQDLLSAYQERGVEGAVDILPTLPPSFFGVGVQTYDKNPTIVATNLAPEDLKLMEKNKYTPENYGDDEVYLKGKPYKISEEQMEQIRVIRAKEAKKIIQEHRSTLRGLTPEAYEKRVNKYYNIALKRARKQVLPKGWSNEKP